MENKSNENLKEIIKRRMDDVVKNGDTFNYWLHNDFINIFLSTHGTATNFYVHISKKQLNTWNMTIDDVKETLISEGFRIKNIFLTDAKNKKNEFEVTNWK